MLLLKLHLRSKRDPHHRVLFMCVGENYKESQREKKRERGWKRMSRSETETEVSLEVVCEENTVDLLAAPSFCHIGLRGPQEKTNPGLKKLFNLPLTQNKWPAGWKSHTNTSRDGAKKTREDKLRNTRSEVLVCNFPSKPVNRITERVGVHADAWSHAQECTHMKRFKHKYPIICLVSKNSWERAVIMKHFQYEVDICCIPRVNN